MRDVEQGLDVLVGVDQLVLEGLAAHMHVGQEVGDGQVDRHGLGLDLDVVRLVGRDLQQELGHADGPHLEPRGFLGEDQSEAHALFGRLAARGVMDLEAQPRAGRQLARHAFVEDAGAVARDIDGPVVLGAPGGELRAGRMDHDDDMVDDVAGAGEDLVGLHPFVLGELGRDDVGLVGHDTAGLDGIGLAERDDRVGLADGPLAVELQGDGGLRGVAERAILRCEPGEEVGLVLGPERAVVGPRAGLAGLRRRREPRGHGALGQHAPDRLGVVRHRAQVVERERRDAMVVVAAYAVRLQDAGDVAVISHGRGRSDARLEVEFATGRAGRADGDRPSGQQVFERGDEIAAGRLFPAVVGAVLVVQRAAITQGAATIQEEHLGRRAGSEGFRQGPVLVVAVGRGEAGFLELRADIRGFLAAHRVDDEQADSPCGQVLLQGGQGGQVTLADRTGRARHRDHEAVRPAQPREAERPALEVGEGLIGDHAADAEVAGFFDDGAGGAGGSRGERGVQQQGGEEDEPGHHRI